MKRFTNNQKIKVSSPEHPLFGRVGSVTRLLFRDDSAWIEMEDAIPDELARFPKGDPRRNHVNIFPEDCEAI